MSYKQLSFEQRCKVAAFLQAGYNQKKIAQEIGVTAPTISRELRRNRRWNGFYSPEQASAFYKGRRTNSRKKTKFNETLATIIKEKIELEWSPEQISGYGKLHNLFDISHERIYQYILSDKKAGGDLYTHLRHGKKRYKKRYGSNKRGSPIKNRVSIDERPPIVEEKQRLGDWEIDTIIGKQHQKAIVTIVERISKKTLIGCVGTKHAEFVANQTIDLLTPIMQYVFTITADNGLEFASHEAIAKALEAKVYFAHPYHSWERGLNENTNGLIRQYIPKGSDFSNLGNDETKKLLKN